MPLKIQDNQLPIFLCSTGQVHLMGEFMTGFKALATALGIQRVCLLFISSARTELD